MSHQHVSLPLIMKPIAGLSRFLFRIGQGDILYSIMGAGASRGSGGNFFKNYVPTKNDVIIACHSRSGTHWMMQIALQIAHQGQCEYDYIYDIVAWPDFIPGVALKLSDPPPPSPTGLRVIKTHAPAQNITVNDSAKYITVIRDPKEVLVSMYHWAPQAFAFMGLQTGTPESWVEKFTKKQIPGGWWAEHTSSWWAIRDKPNVHIVTFNALKANTSAEIERIREFLGVELNPEQRQLVNEKTSFQYMKTINHKFSPIIENTGEMEIIREGKSGTGKDLFTPEQLATVDAYCKSELQRFGSDFPYDDMFT